MEPPQLDPIAGDPLLPIDEVARWLGVSSHTVASYILEGGLRSLDEGGMVAAGDRGTPLVRSREVRRFMKEQFERMSNSARPVVSENLLENTPVLVAYAFVMAMQAKDQQRAWEASSTASQETFKEPGQLMNWWSKYLDIENAPEPGVTSGVYSIGERAVAVMYVADTPPSGGVMQGPAMVMGNPLALVEEKEGWRVDQPLQSHCQDWIHLAGGPQAGSDGGGANGPD